MTPLSIVFRVDATDDEDARRQLADVINTATVVFNALSIAANAQGRRQVVGPNTAQTDQTRRASRPWDDDPRGMGA